MGDRTAKSGRVEAIRQEKLQTLLSKTLKYPVNMVSYWRQAGINYLQYSAICARAVRKCLKPENVTEAMKAPESMLKLTKWQGGKPTDEVKKIVVQGLKSTKCDHQVQERCFMWLLANIVYL